jgi:hypothetical protein
MKKGERQMTVFEVIKAVVNGAIIKDKRNGSYFAEFYSGYEVEEYLICYNAKEAKAEDDLIWEECLTKEEEQENE